MRPVTKVTIEQRPPTPEEQQKIIDAARTEFRRLYEFSVLCNVRTTDLLNLRTEAVNLRSRMFTLEDTAVSGRRITHRECRLPQSAVAIAKEAIGERKDGVVFLSRCGKEWNPQSVSRIFRTLCTKAGLGKEVVLSGRGGGAGKEIEEKPAPPKIAQQVASLQPTT